MHQQTEGQISANSDLLETYQRNLSYNDFFGFEDSPFSISPNPRFLYMSQQHQEALAHLLYGVNTANGFVLLTGEVGTGKTTIIRAFLQHLPNNAEVAFIVHAKLSALELLANISDELSVPKPSNTSVKAFISTINEQLLANHAAGLRTFLLIDEAQHLSLPVLEQIRLLTNLETDEGKLLHIILVGQPELREVFQRDESKQLNQRITARYHLRRLNDIDVSSYVKHRLSVVQAPHNPFSDGTIKLIAKMSKGVPRLINVLCDRALLGAYGRGERIVTTQVMRLAAKEVFDQPKRRLTQLHWQMILGGLLMVLALGLAIMPLINSSAELNTPIPEASRESNTNDVPKTRQTPSSTNTQASTASQPTTSQPVTRSKTTTQTLSPASPSQATSIQTGSKQASILSLLQLWYGPNLNNKLQQKVLANGCEGLSSYGLTCLQDSGTLVSALLADAIFMIPLPTDALTELGLATNSKEPTQWVSVLQNFEDQIILGFNNQKKAVSLLDFVKIWPQSYEYILKSPVNNVFDGDLLQPQYAGWIARSLAKIELNIKPSLIRKSTYTNADLNEIRTEVKNFQRSTDIDADGVVGVQTIIALNQAMDQSMPRLNSAESIVGGSR